MNTAYLSLGSNEGDRSLWMQKAMGLISASCGTITKQSAVYETAAWGITTQPDFLNMAIELQTLYSPIELLKSVLTIETALGRARDIKWGPRIIDIDMLLYNNDVIKEPGLIVPHPFLQLRRFTLVPLIELAPGYIHPVLNISLTDLLAICPDKLEVHPKI